MYDPYDVDNAKRLKTLSVNHGMDKNDLKAIYITNGFEWTPFLEAFLHEWAGRTIYYPQHETGDLVKARMAYLPLIEVGSDYGLHRTTRSFLGEGYAPIGDCENGNVYLFLTDSGKLVGFADYLLLSWGAGTAEDWRKSLELLFAGGAPKCFGEIP